MGDYKVRGSIGSGHIGSQEIRGAVNDLRGGETVTLTGRRSAVHAATSELIRRLPELTIYVEQQRGRFATYTLTSSKASAAS